MNQENSFDLDDELSTELKDIFYDLQNPKIEKSELFGDYKIIIVSNTGYNDNREHALGDESLEEYAKSRLENSYNFSYAHIELQSPNWLSKTIYVDYKEE